MYDTPDPSNVTELETIVLRALHDPLGAPSIFAATLGAVLGSKDALFGVIDMDFIASEVEAKWGADEKEMIFQYAYAMKRQILQFYMDAREKTASSSEEAPQDPQ